MDKEAIVMTEKDKRDLRELKEIVWGADVPSPTCPEYIELHEAMVKITKFINNMLEGATTND